MDINRIVAELKSEREHIDRAIAALGGIGKRAGRLAGKRRMSAEGRRRIAEAARRRWAKFRAAGKKK